MVCVCEFLFVCAHRPGIVHTEKFWRENARFVESEDFKLLRMLIALLSHDDPVRSTFHIFKNQTKKEKKKVLILTPPLFFSPFFLYFPRLS